MAAGKTAKGAGLECACTHKGGRYSTPLECGWLFVDLD
jgi:hypothetical protein